MGRTVLRRVEPAARQHRRHPAEKLFPLLPLLLAAEEQEAELCDSALAVRPCSLLLLRAQLEELLWVPVLLLVRALHPAAPHMAMTSRTDSCSNCCAHRSQHRAPVWIQSNAVHGTLARADAQTLGSTPCEPLSGERQHAVSHNVGANS